jgi:acetyl esterase/lipase
MSLTSQLLHFAIRVLRPLPRTFWSVPRQRRQMETLSRIVRVPAGVKMEKVSAGGVKAWWLIPAVAQAQGMILYFHGGAYAVGSPFTHREITGLLARYAGLRLLSVDYRLAPENPFPAALEDARAAYAWLLEQGHDPARIVLAGDSAGGGLCMSLLLSLRADGLPLPAAAALISPWADLAGTGESVRTRVGIDPLFSPPDLPLAAAHYLNGHNPLDPLISPVYADLRGLPPVLIQVGDREILLSDSTRLYHSLRRSGGEAELSIFPGLWHVFQSAGERMPESKLALQEMGRFLAARAHAALNQ